MFLFLLLIAFNNPRLIKFISKDRHLEIWTTIIIIVENISNCLLHFFYFDDFFSFFWIMLDEINLTFTFVRKSQRTFHLISSLPLRGAAIYANSKCLSHSYVHSCTYRIFHRIARYNLAGHNRSWVFLLFLYSYFLLVSWITLTFELRKIKKKNCIVLRLS